MKKLLLIITVILTSVSGMQASDITVNASDRITNLGGKYYTIHYKFGNGNLYPVIFDGSTLKCSSSTSVNPATLYFSPADNNGLYKIRVYNRDDRYWKFTRDILLGNKTDAVNIQIFQGGSNGTYRICGLTTNQSNSKNSRCYLGNGNGDELNYISSEWTNDAESGKINVNVPQSPGSGNWNSDVVLTEVDPDYVEANALTTGWYQVRVGNSGYVTQNYITTKNENIAEGGYPAKAETLGENIGATMLYFEVGNSATNNVGYWINVRDSKGRYMTRAATSSIVAPTDKICCIYNSGSSTNNLVFTIGTNEISNRTSWKDLGDHIGIASEFPAFFANKASDTYSGNAYAVKVLVGADGTETITYNGSETHYGFNTVYNNGTFFFAQGVTPSANDFTFDKGTNTNYSDNPGIFVDSENKTITVLPRDVDVPSGYNGYIGGNTNISETEWKTKEYWCLASGASWNVGPGYHDSGMWQPIYLKGVTATGINLEGWAFSADLINSRLTANTNKIQSDWTINVAEDSELILTMTSSNSHTDDGTHTFNINGNMTINAKPYRFNGTKVSDNRVNIGENGHFKLISSSNLSISNDGDKASFTINVTPTEPTNYNEVLSQETPFAVIQNVNFNGKLTFGTTETGITWERVNSYADLSNQTAAGEHFYYFIEETELATGEKKYKLYTYKQKIYSRNVTSGNFGSICIPNAVEEMDGIEKVLAVTKVGTDRVVMDVVNVDKMVAGVPYIFKSNDNTINLTLKGETVASPNNDTQSWLVGNFEPTTETPVYYVPMSDDNNSYYVLQSNQFKKVTSANSIKSGSNRCYLKVPATSQSRLSTLGISVDEDGATGIDALNALINNNAEIYDINGRKLKDLRKGINIVNGVKVLVK